MLRGGSTPTQPRAEAWSPVRRRTVPRGRRPHSWKGPRPRTPQLAGHRPVSTPTRLWADLQHHAGALKQLLPSRWRSSKSDVLELQPNELQQDSPESSPDSRAGAAGGSSSFSSSGSSPTTVTARRIILPRAFPPHAEREAAAAAMDVDMSTYNMLMDMQHRDITPEDYEMLRRLDSSVQPKTLSPRLLEKRAPCWRVPDTPAVCVADIADADESSARASAVDQQCSICMENFVADERVRKLPCGHIFHASCVDEWLTRRSNVCPDDGLPVFSDCP